MDDENAGQTNADVGGDARAAVNALILSGGGARGAYEAGVLSYLYEELPGRYKLRPQFQIVNGSSVGAINAAFFAAAAHDSDYMVRNLVSAWSDLRPERIMKVSIRKLLSLPFWAVRGTSADQSGLFDVTPLIHLLRRRVSWTSIPRNISRGPLHALTVSATDLETGMTVVFAQRKGGGAYPPSRDPHVTAVPSIITPKHVLASAAIPLLFPPVLLKNRYYYDGSIRHSTPVSPALRLGAERIFVISLRSAAPTSRFRYDADARGVNPNFLYMAGKIFNAFMLDRLQYDLDRLDRLNAIIEAGEQLFGEAFLKTINQAEMPFRGVGYRKVRHCVIAPSEDLGSVAADMARKYRKQSSSVARSVIQALARFGFIEQSDILSYILFDAPYTRHLIALGKKDARARSDEIAAFFQT